MEKEKFLNKTVAAQIIEYLSNSGKTSYGERFISEGLTEAIKDCTNLSSFFCGEGSLDFWGVGNYPKNFKILKDWGNVVVRELPGIQKIVEKIERLEEEDEKGVESKNKVTSFLSELKSPYGRAYTFDDDEDRYYYFVVIKDADHDYTAEQILNIVKSEYKEDDLSYNPSSFKETMLDENNLIDVVKEHLETGSLIYVSRDYIH